MVVLPNGGNRAELTVKNTLGFLKSKSTEHGLEDIYTISATFGKILNVIYLQICTR